MTIELTRREIMSLVCNESDEMIDARIAYYETNKSEVIANDWLMAYRIYRAYRRGECSSRVIEQFVNPQPSRF